VELISYKEGFIVTNKTTEEREIGWDEEITAESMEWIPLPEGEYDFVVTKFERARYEPGPHAKMPACPLAKIEIMVQEPGTTNTRNLQNNLFLHSRTEWKIAEFFKSIGQKKEGEPFRPNWQMMVGSRGRAKIGIRKYKDKNGNEREGNEVLNFLEPETNPTSTQPQPQQNSWNTGGGF